MPICTGLFLNLKKRLAENNFALDVFYREHDDLHGMEELLTAYHKQGKKIFIVGHSWGACSVFKTFWQYAALPVDLVISLDPVGLVCPHGQAEHIKKWVNVYLDYSVAPFTLGNCVAVSDNLSANGKMHRKIF